MTYHEGELAVQLRAGVELMARRTGRGIHPTIPLVAQHFLDQQTTAVAGSIDERGHVWASLLMGHPGFMTSPDELTLEIDVDTNSGDLLFKNLKVNPKIGMVVIDFLSRQRVRLNGTAEVRSDGLVVRIEQAYANCQKFIQARLSQERLQEPLHRQQSAVLGSLQQEWIAQADTFFIGSYHPEGGVDASHRGGTPGFVRVLSSDTLEFPDYAGNSMFNTLGNITSYPYAGLLFLNFEQGLTLQISGQADVKWESERTAQFPNAERVVEFHIENVIETANAIPFRFDFIQYSPYNQPLV